jgi:hypothetical protein
LRSRKPRIGAAIRDLSRSSIGEQRVAWLSIHFDG